MNVHKKSLILTILVISLYLISGCTKLRYQFDPGYQACSNLSTENTWNPRGWSRHSDYNICLFNLAQKYSDVSLCNEMAPETLGYSGNDMPFSYMGICGGVIAFSENNSRLCNQLNNEYSYEACIKHYSDVNKRNRSSNETYSYEYIGS
jgi:hypothetical protein